MNIAKAIIKEFFNRKGIALNGKNVWDIHINDNRFYTNLLTQGSVGLGESYMRGWWDCAELDQFFERLFVNGFPLIERYNPASIALLVKSKLVDLAPKKDAFLVGEEHYDLGNSLFEAMLDSTMSYTCGYFKGLNKSSDNLYLAQVAKLDLICRKLDLKPNQRVLDIGCGWGGFANYAATKYGAQVVGLTVSKEQASLAQERCKGLPVDIRVQDYRDICEQFDHIVSVGMFEHVGAKNYDTYMEVVKNSLKPDGLFLLHTIGRGKKLQRSMDRWLKKYIFPVGEIPARMQIVNSSQNPSLKIRDWHEFGKNYDYTLMSWFERFDSSWHNLKAEYGHKANTQFYRMWKYYLLSCAGLFRSQTTELWQVVFSHSDQHEDYCEVR